jgi:hypothetical protein
MKTLLNKSSQQIAADYRALWADQKKAKISEQWRYGAELKLLKSAFIVAKESEGVRSK